MTRPITRPMTRIVIMAKAPRPGLAKTRLMPVLGPLGSARLAARMLATTLAAAQAAGLAVVELCVEPDILHPDWQGVELPPEIRICPQGEGDLGARLARAAVRTLAEQPAVLLIGTDCVELDAGLLREAAALLDRHDACLYPTADGGYALLGLRRFHPALFADMPWSTPVVAAETRRRLHALGWSVAVGATLHDIDEPEDLAGLPPAWQETPA